MLLIVISWFFALQFDSCGSEKVFGESKLFKRILSKLKDMKVLLSL